MYIFPCAFAMQIFQMLEFPDEEDRMTTLQELVIYEREDFLKTIYNLTSGLNPDQFEALKSYIFYGPDFDASDYDVRTIMLNTNRLVPPIPPHGYSSQVKLIASIVYLTLLCNWFFSLFCLLFNLFLFLKFLFIFYALSNNFDQFGPVFVMLLKTISRF